MAAFSNLCKTYTIVNRCRTLYNSEIVQGLIPAKGTLCVSDLKNFMEILFPHKYDKFNKTT